MSDEMIESHSKKLLILLLMGLIALLTISSVTATTITITSKPSAGGTGLSYKWTTNTWEDYCPLCNKHGELLINPKGVYEKELTCKYCDADYCGSSGYDKSYNCRAVLSKAQYYNQNMKLPVWQLQKQEHVMDHCQTLVKTYLTST